MTVLQYVKESKDSRLLLLGISEEGESANYTVDSDTYEALGFPEAGEMLDEGQMEIIRRNDEYFRAKKMALSSLAYSDKSRRKLFLKLISEGFDREISGDVVDEMTALGYIDEKRQIDRQILRFANEGLYGPVKIISSLVSKGYSIEQIKSRMVALTDAGELDFEKNKELLLQKRLRNPEDENERKKILFYKGYKL